MLFQFGEERREVNPKCRGWCPMVTDFILSSDSFQGALTSLPERVVGFILFFCTPYVHIFCTTRVIMKELELNVDSVLGCGEQAHQCWGV